MTAHINAKKGDIAKIALIAGDPLRAKLWAETYLDKPKLINQVRNMFGYTGTIKGTKTKVTVMGHGMGLESVGIYSYELMAFFGVDYVIRFGSCGSYTKDIKLGDIIIADKAWTASNYGLGYGTSKDTLSGSKFLVDLAHKIAKEEKMKNTYNTTVNSSMWFYKTHNQDKPAAMVKNGVKVVEMEAYALYAIANSLKKEALTILTVSDSLVTKEEMTPEERQTGFKRMFDFIAKLAVQIDKSKNKK